jgi:hypothetical protein
MSVPGVQHEKNSGSEEDGHPKHSSGIPIPRTDSFLDEEHITLTWRSWVVVLISCFAIFSQVFVVVAAGSVIAFIIRDLGEPAIAGGCLTQVTPINDY